MSACVSSMGNMPTDRHLLITDVDRQSLQLSDSIDVKYPTTSVFDQWWWFLGSALLVTIIIIVCYFVPWVYTYRLKSRTNLQRTPTVPNTYETIGMQHIPNSVPVLQSKNISDSGWWCNNFQMYITGYWFLFLYYFNYNWTLKVQFSGWCASNLSPSNVYFTQLYIFLFVFLFNVYFTQPYFSLVFAWLIFATIMFLLFAITGEGM